MSVSAQPRETTRRTSPRPPAARRRTDKLPGKTTPVELLRVRHRMDALLCLRDVGPLSRVELCRQLGQSTTTMTKVIADLMALGWVAEGAARPSREVGRPRTTLHLDGSGCGVLVVVVEPDALSSAHVGLDLAPQDAHRTRVRVAGRPAADTVATLLSYASKEIDRHAACGHALDALVVVAPGMTDTKLRTSRYAPQLGWRNLEIADPLETALGIPVILHNNARSMALAEFRHLRLHENEPMLFVQARAGLGAALLNSARPGPGGHYGVSELGHIPLGTNEFADRVPTDRQLVSVLQEGYLRQVMRTPEDVASVLRHMEQAEAAGDRVARRLCAQTAGNLASALGVAVNLLNPSVIVIGGIYADASDDFLANVHARLTDHAQPELLVRLRLQRTALGPVGAIQGGAIVAYDRLLRQAGTYRRKAVA